MPTTRKKVIKTVYKKEDSEEETGDFSDSGSEAKISEESSSDDADVDEECDQSSGNEFNEKSKRKNKVCVKRKKTQFTKEFLNKLNKQKIDSEENVDVAPVLFTVKDLTDTDKLLPTFLNLSESDSSDDESPKQSSKQPTTVPASSIFDNSDSETEPPTEYRDVWSNNKQDESEDLAKKTFMELEQHKTIVEQTKASLQNYVAKTNYNKESNVTDLLALGEEISPQKSPVNIVKKSKRNRRGSDSDVDDWEEVKESKSIPQQGLQLFVEFPNTSCRKSKTIDVEMMMKRKINRVKKEYQVYMHKVHVLCWLGHGNYISRVLNDQELMAAALAMVPKGCYPEDRLNMKYVEQVTTWYKDKITIKESKNENKFRPKAPPLINTLLDQIKTRVVTSKKYSVYIFVSMLRALGLQCRVMFNFVTLPLKPLSSELCSLSTKPKDAAKSENTKEAGTSQQKDKPVAKSKAKSKCSKKIAQVDGIYDTESSSDSEIENIMQLDGSDDVLLKPTTTRSTRSKNTKTENAKEDEDVSPPKKSKRGTSKTKNTKEDPESSSKVTQEEVNTRSKKGKETSAKEQKDNPKKNLEATKSPQRTRSNKDKLKATYESGDNNKTESKKEVKREKSPARRKPEIKTEQANTSDDPVNIKSPKSLSLKKSTDSKEVSNPPKEKIVRNSSRIAKNNDKSATNTTKNSKELNPPKILVTNEVNETQAHVESKFFSQPKGSRKRSNTAVASGSESDKCNEKVTNKKGRTKSAPGTAVEKSKYFNDETANKKPKSNRTRVAKKDEEEELRVSHRDLTKKVKSKNDVTNDLIDIIKTRVKDAKTEAKKGIVKGKLKAESDDNSDYLPEEDPKSRKSDSDDDFKPTKVTPKSSAKKNPKPGPSKKIDRSVLSPDEEIIIKTNKIDIWCEIFVEELEQWIAVDVIRGKIHCPNELYSHATHPVCYVVGWDNNNYLKDLTRRYVPHWNTVTRKQRAESEWWKVALAPWLGPKTAKDREEDEQLDRMQLEAPLPKSIAEYKNHPLYALKRHLLKFEVIYPSDAATLGFVRGEGVYARECVYTCRSRDTWLKEAKVVRLGEQPYKIVKARPKWDKLSNKLITDKPLEVFGPWQVQDYEPPVAENGLVPRNAYGNVELFKECMLPKGTVHIKLPGLNKVAKKLNIDCAPAMTGFDFNGGWSHPVYDGFVVCKEFEEIITEAWVKDQEEQERKELEKIELRVYGNWKKLIKGLLIRERLKLKYGFEEPSTSQSKGKSKGPRLIVKKK